MHGFMSAFPDAVSAFFCYNNYMDRNKNKKGAGWMGYLKTIPLKADPLKTKNLKAYTLIELVVVLAITVLLLTIGIGGLMNGQKQFNFQANYERILQMVRDARSLALNGKAFPDYTDYNRNGNTTDLMTPANVGVDFDVVNGTVTMFADLHNGKTDSTQNEGVYDAPVPFGFYTYTAGKDVAIEQYKLNPTMTLLISGGPRTIFFSPIFADVKFYPALPPANKFFFFGGKENTGTRKGCAKIHPVSGIPEIAEAAECP
jgi:type II secretory pathway pseudopilin PulG